MKKKTGHSSERDSPADGHLVAGKPKKEAYKRPLTDPRMTKRTATPANGGEENVSADNGASPPANQQKLSQPVTNVTTEARENNFGCILVVLLMLTFTHAIIIHVLAIVAGFKK